MKSLFSKVFAVASLAALILPAKAWALFGGTELTAKALGFEEKDSDLFWWFGAGVGLVMSFIGVLFLVMMMVGGYIWMTAAGNEDKVSVAKKLLVAALIGLIIVLSAYAITLTFDSSLNPNNASFIRE